MTLRIAFISLLAVVLMGLLVYSQMIPDQPRVSGYVEADEIRLGSRVGGRVKDVMAEEGQSIKPGDVLVLLEEFDLAEREAQARALLAARDAEYRRIVAGFRTEEKAQAAARVERLKQKLKALVDGPRPEEREAARARVRLAQAQLDLAQSTYARNSALYERDKGLVTREALDRSIEELKTAQANKEVREQDLLLSEKGTRAEDIAASRAELDEADQAWRLTETGNRPEDIERAKAEVEAARAAAAVLQVAREELKIASPVGGMVEVLELQPGDVVAAGAPVLSVIDLSRLWVRAYIPENRLGLQIGQKLRVTIDSYPDESFTGTVTFVSRQAEFTPNNVQTPEERSKQVFRIKVELPADTRIRPGMAADVWLETRS